MTNVLIVIGAGQIGQAMRDGWVWTNVIYWQTCVPITLMQRLTSYRMPDTR
jgi:hypothetical protein